MVHLVPTLVSQSPLIKHLHVFTMKLIKHLSCACCAIDFQILFMQEHLTSSVKLGRVGSLSKEGLINFFYYPVFQKYQRPRVMVNSTMQPTGQGCSKLTRSSPFTVVEWEAIHAPLYYSACLRHQLYKAFCTYPLKLIRGVREEASARYICFLFPEWQ